jgi:hypothetical protein
VRIEHPLANSIAAWHHQRRMNAFAPLDSLFDPAHPSFTAEGVRRLLELRCSEQEQTQMEIFAAKANEGTLTPEERRQYESWVRAGALMSMLKAKARFYLKNVAGTR